MKVTARNWQMTADGGYHSSRTNQDHKTKADTKQDSPNPLDTDFLEASAASLLKSDTDSKATSALSSDSSKKSESDSFKMSASGPKNSVGELASMLARAETTMDVQLVLSKATRALVDLKMAAMASEGKDAKKYAQQIKRMEKLIKKINKKLKHLSKEERLKQQAEQAAKKAELEKEKQIRQELQTRKKKRRREEREYALKEMAADGKNSLNETVSSLLNASSPSADISSLTGAGGEMMAADFSGMDMGSFDIMV